MTKNLLIGIDVGTTSTKAVLFDRDGALLAEAAQEYPTAFPHNGWAEQDPENWWRATCVTLQRLFADKRYAPADVAAVGISCQAPSMTPVDAAGQPLAPALIWMDRRTEAECTWLREQVGEDLISRINGGRVDPYYMAPKILWFKTQRPELYRQTHQLLQANGYVVQKLCGTFTMDRSHGPITSLFDSRNGIWSSELLAATGIDRAKLPPLANCADIVGEVTRTAAVATGLAAGTPVIAGMTDGTAAGIEAGLINRGEAVEMTGQSTVLLICNDQPYLGRDLIPLGHAIPGKHLVVGALVASGGALRWFRDQLAKRELDRAAAEQIDPFDLLSAEARQSPPGANRLVFLPYMYGERSPIWDSAARGVFFGLSLASQRRDLIRAIMEGAAYGLRHNIEVATAGGFAVTSLACVGGGARSALWNQIKADVLQRPIHLPKAATGAPFGDAVVAAAAVGLYPSIEAAVATMVQAGARYEPDGTLAEQYNALYQIYLDLYPALRASFKALAAVPEA
jgi:xylulokinase